MGARRYAKAALWVHIGTLKHPQLLIKYKRKECYDWTRRIWEEKNGKESAGVKVGVEGVLVFRREEGMRDVVWQVGVRGEMQQAVTRRARRDGDRCYVWRPDCLQGRDGSHCGT